jgi:glycosyltransferase involved in cell wall biosynthesis
VSRVVLVGAQPRSLIIFRGELIKAIVAAGWDVTAMAADATVEEIESLRALGADYRAYPVQRHGLNPLRDLITLCSLRAAFRDLRPDVVLSYTIKPIIWGGLAAVRIPKLRFYGLVTGLGYGFHGGSLRRRALSKLVTWLYRLGLDHATGVVFQNRDNAELFIARGIVPGAKCSVTAGSGVDLRHFSMVPLPANDVVFLAISRLLGEKGLREFAAAARMVKEHHPEANFWLVGPEDPSPDGIPLREVLGWHESGWVVYHGEKMDVRPFLAASSVFVLPSHHEGMPRAVLEALAVGRPVITTDVPGCRETVVPNENGFLVPSGDSRALAERMIWFLDNRSEWARMALRSRRLAEERFDVLQVNQQLLRFMKIGGEIGRPLE